MVLQVVRASGTSIGGPSTSTNPQRTASPQRTTSAQSLQPTVNPFNVINDAPATGSGGGGTQLGSTTPYVDPYAAWGGLSAFNQLVDGFNTQKDSIYDSSAAAAKNSGISLRNSILDWVDSLRSGQSMVDNRGINNELAKQRGVADVYGSMNRGIRSGGVTLANRNASDSSAAGAIARAYGDLGRRQMSDIGNQYELENQEIGLAQQDLDRQRASGLRRFDSSEEQIVNSILADATDKLAALDAAMAGANLPERLAIDAEKSKIKAQVSSILDPYNDGIANAEKIKAMNLQGRVAEATRRGALGQAPASQFDYSTDAPLLLQGSGPVSSELPIFTYRNDEE